MKGEIFSIFERFVAQNFGQATYEQALEDAAPKLSTPNPFVGPEVYPDSDLFALVESVLAIIKAPLNHALCLFGNFAFRYLAESIPSLMSRYDSLIPLLRDLDGIIHVEVRKLCEATRPPRFTLQEVSGEEVLLTYQSERKLYDLAEGLVRGAAAYFKQEVEVSRELHSDGRCTFRICLHGK